MTATTELADWLSGTATGGPNGDGRYPMTGQGGQTYLIYCPAALALNPAYEEQPIETFSTIASHSATVATDQADRATTAADNATTSANAAEDSATAAANSETNAEASKTTAVSSASAAATNASTADTAKTVAVAARDKAQLWANAAENFEVDPGAYSAYHWAKIAESSNWLTNYGVYTPGVTDFVAGTQAGVNIRMPMNKMAYAMQVITPWDGGIARTLAEIIADSVSVKDFGAVGNGVADDTVAVRTAYDAAVASGKGLYYPAGNFKHTGTITMPSGVSIRGAGLGRTTLTHQSNGALFKFTNTAVGAYLDFADFRYNGVGNVETNTASCCFYVDTNSVGLTFCRFRNIHAQGVYAFFKSDATAFSSSPGLAGRVNWCSFNEITFRNGVKYGYLFNQGSGTGNSWSGGKPAISIAGGAVVEMNGNGCNVGDMIFSNIHSLTEGGVASTVAFFRGGPNTTYRSRISFNDCQFDAQMDIPLDLSNVGSTQWSNIRLPDTNNIGGGVDLCGSVPNITRSIIVDQGVSQWRSQFSYSLGGVTTAQSKDAFKITVDGTNPGSGLVVEIIVSGGVAGVGGSVGVWKYIIRSNGSNAPVITEVSENRSGSTTYGFDIVATGSTGGVATFAVSWLPTSAGTSVIDAQLIAVGGAFNVQNGRYL